MPNYSYNPFGGGYYPQAQRPGGRPGPGAPYPYRPVPRPGGGPLGPMPMPGPSAPMMQPPVIVQPALVQVQPETVAKKPNALDALVKHPVAPVVGGILVLASYFTDEPKPPEIPHDLPEPTAKQWQMIYQQNLQRYERRMELLQTIGLALLGYASTQAVLDALPPKKGA